VHCAEAIAVVLLLVGSRGHALDAQPVLTAGQLLDGDVTVARLAAGTCLAADGRVAAGVLDSDGGHALACIDPTRAVAVARQGDPSPRGGRFTAFEDCALLGDGSIYFAALRRSADGPPARDIYRADADGIRWIIGAGIPADDGTPLQFLLTLSGSSLPPVFAVNDRGTVLVRMQTPTGALLTRRRAGGEPEVLRAVANSGRPSIIGNRREAALAADDAVVALAYLPGGGPAIVALENSESRVLFAMPRIAADLGLVAPINPSLWSLALGQAAFAFRLEYYHSPSDWRRGWVRYSPARGFHRAVPDDTYDDETVIAVSPGGLTLAAGYRFPPPVGTETEYLLIDDASTAIVGRDDSPYGYPNALAVNDRGTVLMRSRRGLSLLGPPADAAARCVVPPTAVAPTPPPTATATPTRTHTPTVDCGADATACARLRVSSAAGGPGERIEVAVALDAGRWTVAGVAADFALLDVAPVAANADGSPACRLDVATGKPDSRFAFQPFGCGDDCTAVRALVLSLRDTEPIPGTAPLFVCELQIGAGAAAGRYPLRLSAASAADVAGNEIPVAVAAGTLVIHAAGDHASVDGDASGASGCQIDPAAANDLYLPLGALVLRLVGARRRRPPAAGPG
jgi:hypothetical protein